MKTKTTSIKRLVLGLVALTSAGFLAAAPAQQQYPAFAVPAGETAPVVDSAPANSGKSAATASSASAGSSKAAAASASNSNNAVAASADAFRSNRYDVEKVLLTDAKTTGGEYVYRISVKANADITNVIVKESLPSNLKFVRATPEAKVDGGKYAWGWDSMAAGEVQNVDVVVIPQVDGQYLTTTKVCIDPVVVLPLRSGSPKLELAKSGPANAEPGQTINYSITVKNTGTAEAMDVVVTDTLPEGLSSANGGQVVAYQVGTLAAGEEKSVSVPVKVNARGSYVNKAEAKSANGAYAQTESTALLVSQSKVDLKKSGASTEFVFRNSVFTLDVTNSGETVLKDVVVTDKLPSGCKFISANGGGQLNKSGSVVWNIASMQPGETVTYNVVMSHHSPGTTVNEATVTTANGVSAADKVTTVWEGAPGVMTEITDDVDPISVGGTTTYTVRVKNQGTHRSVNALIRVVLSEELAVDAVSSQEHTVEGNTVTFPEVVLKPKGDVVIKIKAKAVKNGVAHARFEMESSFLPRPVVKEETTFVY